MFKYLITLFTALLLASPALAAVEIGKLAPNFSGTDMNGNNVTLEQYRGKNVVLEWSNPECPFVVKHYKSNNMQSLQKTSTEDGTIWLTINSSGEGKQGHLTPDQAKALYQEKNLASTNYILDPEGEIGKLYEAKTTPHMFVINTEGILVYAGAIDSVASFDSKDIEGADNYVLNTLQLLNKNKEIKISSTKPYGCSIKYKN